MNVCEVYTKRRTLANSFITKLLFTFTLSKYFLYSAVFLAFDPQTTITTFITHKLIVWHMRFTNTLFTLHEKCVYNNEEYGHILVQCFKYL